jgi:hypothetical protein
VKRLGVVLLAPILAAAPSFAIDRRPGAGGSRALEPDLARVRSEALDPSERSDAGAAARAFLGARGGEWRIDLDRRTGRAVLVEGTGIPLVAGRGNSLSRSPGSPDVPTIDSLEPLARALIRAHAPLLEPPRGQLVLDRRRSIVRAGGRLASLSFEWRVDGIHVEGASVFVHVNAGNATQLGAPLVGPITAPTRALVTADAARTALLHYAGVGESPMWIGEPELLIQVEERGDALDHRLVWSATYRVPGLIGNWEGRIDARTGEVIALRDTNRYGRVTGGVYPRTVFDHDEVVVPLPFVRVVVPEDSVVTDASGYFSNVPGGTGGGTSGPWFVTSCQGCSSPLQSGTTGFGGGQIALGTGGLDQVGNGRSVPADRNTFYHLNQVRRIALKWLPALGWLYTQVRSFTNIQDTCNAFYDGDVNFFRSGGGCNNTGEIADVVYHEWGHGLDLNTNAGDGATGEATADVVSMHVTRSPLIGPGFRVDGTPVRNVDPAGPRGPLTVANVGTKCPSIGSLGPLGYEVHCEGEIYGQAAWQLSQALVARHGHHTGWRESEKIFFNSLPDAGGYLATSALPVYSAYLFADDDDGNLTNGTPHATEIYNAFNAHGIALAQRPATPHCARPAQPVVTVTPACDGVQVSWTAVPGAVTYEVLRGEVRLDQPQLPIASIVPPSTSFHDTEAAPATDYWYVVMAVDAAGCESTIESPVAARRLPQPVLSVVSVTPDDTPRGNRSGTTDPNEEVDLSIAIENTGDAAATSLSATLSPLSSVVLLDPSAAWPDVAPGASTTSADVLRFRANSPPNACGDRLRFRLDASEATGCSVDESYFEVELGVQGFCDPTPACYVPPTFSGLASAASGASCAETALAWSAAQTHCTNAGIRYNVYRSTSPGFVPGPSTLVAQQILPTTFTDRLLVPGATYEYVVRAYDTRSGEESNLVRRSALSPAAPDTAPPIFTGLQSAVTAPGCAATTLSWNPGGETCSGPAAYDVFRSTDPVFTPEPANRVGRSLSTTFVDSTPGAGQAYTYVVRACDTLGNCDANSIHLTATSGVLDRVVYRTGFESGPSGFAVDFPNTATTGNWALGTPADTGVQPGTCAEGTRCWITGLAAALPNGDNNDVDGGDTTLISSDAYDLSELVDPVIEYERWYTNDQGANPGEDNAYIEISTDGGAEWAQLEHLAGGTPLAWVRPRIAVPETVPRGVARFRFLVSDRGNGSLVEAGFDDLTILDRNQGCAGCALPVAAVTRILARREGADVVLDWTTDPAPGARFAVYLVSGPTFASFVRIGTTDGRTFRHEGAVALPTDTAYRVSAINGCGNESGP